MSASVTWHTWRSPLVSSVVSRRAKVPYAICSIRMCSRESFVGRRKSYATTTPERPAGRAGAASSTALSGVGGTKAPIGSPTRNLSAGLNQAGSAYWVTNWVGKVANTSPG